MSILNQILIEKDEYQWCHMPMFNQEWAEIGDEICIIPDGIMKFQVFKVRTGGWVYMRTEYTEMYDHLGASTEWFKDKPEMVEALEIELTEMRLVRLSYPNGEGS